MSKDHEVHLPLQPNDKKATHLEVRLDYWKDARVRGVYVHVGPVQIEDRVLDGIAYSMRSFMLCSGKTELVEACTRLNRNRLSVIAAKMLEDARLGRCRAGDLVREVLAKHGLTLAERAA